jgi:adenylate cyclase
VLGFTAAGFDEVPTPFGPVVSGVEVQATVIDNILHQRSLRRPWWIVPGEAASILGLGLLVGLFLRWLPTGWSAAAVAGLALAWAWGTQRLFSVERLALGGVYPLAAMVFCTLGGGVYQTIAEGREKRTIRRAFAHYVNREVADMISREPAQLRLGGERREITVLASDIRGFTGIAEGLPPEVLGELLNEYLSAMTDILFRHGGLLDKYIGDAVMAFWGAPVSVPDHAARCCHAALDMLAALVGLQARWRSAQLPPMDIRIGINSGDAIVGNFGSSQRFNYTAVGDDVNIAFRLEQLNKRYGTWILVTERTRHAAGDLFVFREVDRTQVRGRLHPVGIFELLGRRADDRDGSLADRALRFEAALEASRRRAWNEAVERLQALATAYPNDHAVPPLLRYCQAALAGEPSALD